MCVDNQSVNEYKQIKMKQLKTTHMKNNQKNDAVHSNNVSIAENSFREAKQNLTSVDGSSDVGSTSRLYHYTKGCVLGKIVHDGFIKRSTACIEKREKPAVWLTRSPEWEVACNIGQVVNHENLEYGQVYSSDEVETITVNNDYMRCKIGMCRIIINEELPVTSWAKFKYVSGISERMYYALDAYSRSVGSPVGKWGCRFSDIPEKYWEGIEMLAGDKWVRWDEKMPIEDFIQLCLSCNE